MCIPAGTRNDFALDLGIDQGDVVGALDAFMNGVERRVDLARVNGCSSTTPVWVLYSKVVQSEAYREAKLQTAADMLPDLLGPGAEPFDLRFVDPTAANAPWPTCCWYRTIRMSSFTSGRGTRQRTDLGTLGVMAARIDGPKEAVTFAGLEAAGRVRKFRGWLESSTPTFRVDSDGPIEIGIDGEAMRLDPPLIFESWPGELRVRIPKHASGVAPAGAAVQLTSSTIGDLVLTAAGRPVARP